MRNISFALTEPQILDRSKTVTRRLGWLHAKVGQQLQPVRKAMGLKPGERVVRLGGPIIVTDVRRELLRAMLDDVFYGRQEVALEGFFPHGGEFYTPHGFVAFFCKANKCQPDVVLTRIAFDYA